MPFRRRGRDLGGGRRRTSQWKAVCSPCSPAFAGATIPGTGRRPGQTVPRAQRLQASHDLGPDAHRPIPDYHKGAPFSSYRVPQGGITDCSRSWVSSLAKSKPRPKP